uniref:Uncharacterized protein n=1 Tax=Odontella aurita TaxID=265563 RepID=A0A7S4J0B0_9STRA|mmetsp:Transcript_34628/g.103441  ORF Transcript_34628/g.103441 Transcript_34628/m.103441 type:complete len:236 (+) Transcript_34628:3-710(+)
MTLPTRLHEEVLCVVRYHSSGLLEVKPGFSEVEPEEDDLYYHDRIFISDATCTTRRSVGPCLTTFCFSSPQGSTYEYTLEHVEVDVGICNGPEFDENAIDDHNRQMQHIEKRISHYNHCMQRCWDATNAFPKRQVMIEIISVSGSDQKNDPIFIRYDISLPHKWAIHTGTELGPSLSCRVCQENRSTSGFFTGMTQRTLRAQRSILSTNALFSAGSDVLCLSAVLVLVRNLELLA